MSRDDEDEPLPSESTDRDPRAADPTEHATRMAAPRVGDDEAPTRLAEDDDRTQLVPRPTTPERADDSDADAATELVGEPAPSDRAGGALAPTRVLGDDPDKTAPPPVEAAPAAAPPPRPAATDESDRGLSPGTVLFGEYEIVNVLGVGGMGEVYRARHRRLDEHRAIKVMHAELSQKKGASEFFYREAKALLAVRHPAVVHCHDLLSDDAGRVYLIMEMIEGIPLSKKMNDGPLSPDDVAILGARISHGLSAAHRKGVIHRDVSPDNIVLPNGNVREAKLIDFGIAKILEQGEGTIVDGFKGKLSYASPEQLGFFGGKIDGRSDFYSLGLVLAAAALGRPMGMGTTVMEAVDARRSFQALPDEIPMGLRSAIQPLLALDPKDRPKYVDRLFVVPGGIEGTDPGAGAAAEGATPTREAASRSTLVAAAALVVLLLGLGGAGWLLGLGGSETTTPEIASPLRPEAGGPDGVAPAPTQVRPGAEAPAPATTPAPPPKRRITGSDRIRIIGLLNNAKLALSENRLMSPAGDNAFDRYRRVLELDPENRPARDGLRAVADRYLVLAEASSKGGDAPAARDFLVKARRADPGHPGLAAAEARLAP